MHRLLICFLAVFISAATSAQTADEIISKHIEFVGGVKAWKKVSTIITSGEYNYGGMPFPFTTYAKAPARYKFIVPFNGKYYAQGFDGEKGWKIDAFKNETTPTFLSGKEARALANEADVELESALIGYQAKGHKAEFTGMDTAQAKQCYVVKFTRKEGDIEHYYFSDDTYELVLKKAYAKNSELTGTLLSLYYRDYRNISGIKIPFKIISESNGQVLLTITLDKVSLNTPIKDAVFQPQ